MNVRLFFSFSFYTDATAFYDPPLHLPSSHESGPDPLLNSRQMMCSRRLCTSLICLVLPLSLSCAPSFRTVTYSCQLCREPQSVFMESCALSHTAVQLPTLLVVQPSCLWPCFFFFFALVVVRSRSAAVSFSPAAALLERRWGELLMACSLQPAVPATAIRTAYTTPSSENTLTKNNRSEFQCSSKHLLKQSRMIVGVFLRAGLLLIF